VRTEERRRGREREAAEMQIDIGSEPNGRKSNPCWTKAITVLPKKDRDAVLLRYFQRRSLREVGKELGTSEDGARKRWIELLGNCAGSSPTKADVVGGILVGALSDRAMQAAPGGLAVAVRALVTQPARHCPRRR